MNCNYFSPSILEPFLKNVIRNFVLNTKRLEGFPIKQNLCIVQKVKLFKIFTVVHDYKNLFAAKIELSINSFFDSLSSALDVKFIITSYQQQVARPLSQGLG